MKDFDTSIDFSPRHRADGDLGAMTMDAFTAILRDVVDTKAKK